LSTADNFRVAEHHHLLIDWWRQRKVKCASVVHVDFHSDLRCEEDPSAADPGNFLAIAVRERRVQQIHWVVPFTRRALAAGLGQRLVETLPVALFTPSRESEAGRLRGRVLSIPIALHGCDDLPKIDDDGGLEISFDLDFFYHHAVGGPTLNPVEWMRTFRKWREPLMRATTFLSLSLSDGYAPPTYRPIGRWLSQVLRGGGEDAECEAVWARVLAAERARVSQSQDQRRSKPSPPQDRAEAAFWTAWMAYMAEDWKAFAAALEQTESLLRFRPIEELLVCYQAQTIAPRRVRERVRRALCAMARQPGALDGSFHAELPRYGQPA